MSAQRCSFVVVIVIVVTVTAVQESIQIGGIGLIELSRLAVDFLDVLLVGLDVVQHKIHLDHESLRKLGGGGW